MKKGTKLLKRLVALFLVVLMSINTMAAIVSDNDGAAFVTKAEFEALKSNFASQIDRYNTSIDSKIDGLVANYLAGIKLSERIELTSMLNQLKSFHFSRNFNYFGNGSWSGTRIGDEYKWWSYYGGTWGIDRASQGIDSHIMVGIRGGTGIVNISEETSGTYMDRYIVCNKGNFDNTEPTPAYGMSSYIYYAMLWLSSNYGCGETTYFNNSYNQSVTGTLTGTQYGLRFWTDSFPNIPPNDAGHAIKASMMYSAIPVDTAWPSGYDANCLPGSKMSTTDKCLYIYSEDLMKVGSSDGVFLTNTADENAYWKKRSGRSYSVEARVKLYATKYKRKYNEKLWKDIVVDDISVVSGVKTYYYSGLPIFKATDNGTVTMKIKPVNTGGAITTVAISEDQFDNSTVTAGISRVTDADCNFTNWDMASGTECEIKFAVKKDKTYWIKALPQTTGNWTTFTTSKIELLID